MLFRQNIRNYLLYLEAIFSIWSRQAHLTVEPIDHSSTIIATLIKYYIFITNFCALIIIYS